MNVISRKTLKDFYKKHADSKSALSFWYQDAKKSDWASLNQIKERYPKASIIKGNRVIFDIKGNKYRLVVKIAFKMRTIFIEWLGTHAEYNRKKF